jgi:outer membrane immunogenic protein
MKNSKPILSAALAVSAMLGIGAASAADLPVKASGPAPQVAAYNWSGLYIGAHLGGIGGNFSNDPAIIGPTGTGGNAMGGLQIGYNWQINQFILGAEADVSGIDVPASSAGSSFKENWMSTYRVRAGQTMGNYLLYVTGGVALTGLKASVTGGGSATATQTGFTVGGGLETFLWSPHWSVRFEYLYVDVPKYTFNIVGGPVTGGSSNNVGRVAVNYKF